MLRPSSTLSLSGTLAFVTLTSPFVLYLYPIQLAHLADTLILQLLPYIPYRKPILRTHTLTHILPCSFLTLKNDLSHAWLCISTSTYPRSSQTLDVSGTRNTRRTFPCRFRTYLKPLASDTLSGDRVFGLFCHRNVSGTLACLCIYSQSSSLRRIRSYLLVT